MYMVICFAGSFQSAGVIQHAYNFNSDIFVIGASVSEGGFKTDNCHRLVHE